MPQHVNPAHPKHKHQLRRLPNNEPGVEPLVCSSLVHVTRRQMSCPICGAPTVWDATKVASAVQESCPSCGWWGLWCAPANDAMLVRAPKDACDRWLDEGWRLTGWHGVYSMQAHDLGSVDHMDGLLRRREELASQGVVIAAREIRHEKSASEEPSAKAEILEFRPHQGIDE